MSYPPFESWQTAQLTKIGFQSPERLSELMSALWSRYPALFEELAIRAVDEKQLSVERAAELIGTSVADLNEKLDHYHHSGDFRIDFEGGVAKLLSCNIAVWEVAREFSRHESIETLSANFPGIPISDLKAALRYAEGNEKEIAEAIARFEKVYEKKYIV